MNDIYTPKLRVLRPLLRQWIRNNVQLAYRWEEYGDVPWWYNERASISLLAGAAWKAKRGYAFEEFVGDKRKVNRKKVRLSSGRFDLEFCASESLFIAEAKQCWIPATRRQDCFERVSEAMDRARNDVRRCEPQGVRRLAIVFGVPYFSKKQQAEMPKKIARLVEFALDVEAHAYAWAFPRLEPYPEEGGYLHPGVMIWIREVKR
jgi:hypothetical protein